MSSEYYHKLVKSVQENAGDQIAGLGVMRVIIAYTKLGGVGKYDYLKLIGEPVSLNDALELFDGMDFHCATLSLEKGWELTINAYDGFKRLEQKNATKTGENKMTGEPQLSNPSALELAMLEADSAQIVIRIAAGDRLQEPTALLSSNFFVHTSLRAAMLLLEVGMSAPVREKAIKFLKEFHAPAKNQDEFSHLPELIELLEDACKPLDEQPEALELELIAAIENRRTDKILELIFKREAMLHQIAPVVNLDFAQLELKAILAILDRGISMRALPRAFAAITQILESEKLSGKEYSDRVMIAKAICRLMQGNLSWETNQHDQVWFPYPGFGKTIKVITDPRKRCFMRKCGRNWKKLCKLQREKIL
jgi:hypothetical protein